MDGAQRRAGILSEEFADEAILYNQQRGAMHLLNVTAQAIWRLCDGQQDAPAMADALRRQFDIAEDQDVLADVQRTLATLADCGLLESTTVGDG